MPLNYYTFATSLSTNTKSVALPLWPVEARAGSEQVHKPCCSCWGTQSDIFLYLRAADRTLLFVTHARLQLDRPLKESPLPIPAGPADRVLDSSTSLRGERSGGRWIILIQVFEHGFDQFFRRFSRSSLGPGGERAAWTRGIGTRGVCMGGGTPQLAYGSNNPAANKF